MFIVPTLKGLTGGNSASKTFANAGLDLNFALNKSLVDRVSGNNLVTFTRASSGTYVDSQGVIRTATTNLLLRSEELATSPWFSSNVTLTNNSTDVVDPAGGNKSTKIVATGSGSSIGQPATISAASTGSIWLRTASGTATFTLIIYLSGAPFTNIGTQSITVTTTWQRFSVTSSTPPSAATYNFQLNTMPAATLYAWGAQLEQSTTVGEYIPTTSVINSAPRFDHNPTTGESLGLLVEEQRTNLLQQSENFGTTWTAFNLLAFGSGSTLNAAVAPDGQTTADLITENTANAQHNISQSSTTTGAKRFSVFAKQGPGSRLLRMIDFNPTDGAQGETYFNLTTGVVVSGTGSIQAFPNGWYRCSIQSTTTVTSTYFISLAQNSTTFSYTGDGTSGLLLWGAQLEAGTFPTSYIPTTTATVTRAADVASITGTSFSSWYRQDEGTVFVDVLRSYSGNFPGFPNIYSFNDNTANNLFTLYGNQNTGALTNFSIQSGGVSQTDYVQRNSIFPGPNRVAQALAVNSSMFVVNGSLTTEDNSVTMPVGINRVSIGGDRTALAQWGGHIRRFTYWPQRLSNSTLQQITV